MGSSYTEFQGNGFWCRDTALEIWLYLLVQEIDRHKPLPEWLAAARDHWYACATVGFSGCINADLDSLLSDGEQVNTAVALAHEALHSLKQKGSVLPRTLLNDLPIGGTDSPFTRDAETLTLRQVGEAFVDLLRGEWHTSASDSPMLGM
jgi:hypothetical protein